MTALLHMAFVKTLDLGPLTKCFRPVHGFTRDSLHVYSIWHKCSFYEFIKLVESAAAQPVLIKYLT